MLRESFAAGSDMPNSYPSSILGETLDAGGESTAGHLSEALPPFFTAMASGTLLLLAPLPWGTLANGV